MAINPFDTRMVQIADRLVTKFFREAILHKVTSVATQATGEVTRSVVSYDILGASTGTMETEDNPAHLPNVDAVFYMRANGAAQPERQDQIEFGGNIFEIVDVDTIGANQAVIYRLLLKDSLA